LSDIANKKWKKLEQNSTVYKRVKAKCVQNAARHHQNTIRMSLHDFTIAKKRLEAKLAELNMGPGPFEYFTGLLFGSFVAYVLTKDCGCSVPLATLTGVVSFVAGTAVPCLALVAPAAYAGTL
jgi:hypothetical protein